MAIRVPTGVPSLAPTWRLPLFLPVLQYISSVSDCSFPLQGPVSKTAVLAASHRFRTGDGRNRTAGIIAPAALLQATSGVRIRPPDWVASTDRPGPAPFVCLSTDLGHAAKYGATACQRQPPD